MRITFLSFLLLTGPILMAQDIQLPKRVAGIPEELSTYHVHNDIGRIKQNKDRKQYWIIHSDREGVPVYSTASGNSFIQGKSLKMGQPVYVAETSGSRALVFDMVKASSGWPNVSSDAVAIGWVDLEQCFLSSYCLKGEGLLSGKKGKMFSLPRKAILAPETNYSRGTKEKLSFYGAPGSAAKQYNSKPFLFEPYYIMKEENGWLLLSKTDKMSGDPIRAESEMIGWIKASKVVEWGTRTTLEPNWTRAAKDTFDEGVWAFPSKSNAESYQQSASATSGGLHKFRCTGGRMKGETMRPISLSNDDGVVKALLTLNPGNNINEQLKEEIKKIKEQQNNINIVFVIDGTKSMDPYYEPCVSAIEEASRAIRARQSSANIKYGVVIYRDLGNPADALDLLPLSRSIDAVKNFLRGVECKSVGDRDIPESVFYGLYDGLEKLNIPDDQSNLVIHVGDAGNPIEFDATKTPPGGKHRTAEDIGSMASSLSLNIVSFQVNRGAHPSYFHFGQQMKAIMNYAMNRNKVARGSTWESKRKVSSGYELIAVNANKDAPIIPVFELTLAEEGQTSTKVLQEAIENAIVEMDQQTQRRINWLEGQITSVDPSPEFKKWLEDQLRKQGKSESQIKSRIDELSKSKGDIIEEGYTVQEVAWSGSTAPFRSVIYLSEREFRDLIGQMKALNALENQSVQSQRKGFIDVLITQVLASAGLSLDNIPQEERDRYNEQLESKSMAEIWESLFGYVPDYGPEVVNLPLGNFAKEQSKTSEKGLSGQDWNEFFDAFIKKYNNVKKYSSQKYPYFKLIGANNRYYWIDAQEMP